MTVELVQFVPWPKIQRTDRNHVVFTEKIDGTNAAIGVRVIHGGMVPESYESITGAFAPDGGMYVIRAQSRKRFITPKADNAGFAAWAFHHGPELATFLGEGLHFGEWWGQGIQRGYGMDRKVFSLFNASRWSEPMLEAPDMYAIGVDVVPVLGVWDGNDFARGLNLALLGLGDDGLGHRSPAAAHHGVVYGRPEGVMSYWTAFNSHLKYIIDK